MYRVLRERAVSSTGVPQGRGELHQCIMFCWEELIYIHMYSKAYQQQFMKGIMEQHVSFEDNLMSAL